MAHPYYYTHDIETGDKVKIPGGWLKIVNYDPRNVYTLKDCFGKIYEWEPLDFEGATMKRWKTKLTLPKNTFHF